MFNEEDLKWTNKDCALLVTTVKGRKTMYLVYILRNTKYTVYSRLQKKNIGLNVAVDGKYMDRKCNKLFVASIHKREIEHCNLRVTYMCVHYVFQDSITLDHFQMP